jgi:hypothetical protein
VRRGALITNRLDWAQIAPSLGVMLIALYIALSRRRVHATTRVGGFGLSLLGLSYFVGGFEGSAIEGPLLDRVEAYSALVGVLVVLGALIWQARGR